MSVPDAAPVGVSGGESKSVADDVVVSMSICGCISNNRDHELFMIGSFSVDIVSKLSSYMM